MFESRQQIGLATIACHVVTVPVTSIAEADSAATGGAVGSGIGNDATFLRALGGSYLLELSKDAVGSLLRREFGNIQLEVWDADWPEYLQ